MPPDTPAQLRTHGQLAQPHTHRHTGSARYSPSFSLRWPLSLRTITRVRPEPQMSLVRERGDKHWSTSLSGKRIRGRVRAQERVMAWNWGSKQKERPGSFRWSETGGPQLPSTHPCRPRPLHRIGIWNPARHDRPEGPRGPRSQTPDIYFNNASMGWTWEPKAIMAEPGQETSVNELASSCLVQGPNCLSTDLHSWQQTHREEQRMWPQDN